MQTNKYSCQIRRQLYKHVLMTRFKAETVSADRIQESRQQQNDLHLDSTRP